MEGFSGGKKGKWLFFNLRYQRSRVDIKPVLYVDMVIVGNKRMLLFRSKRKTQLQKIDVS